MLDMFDPSRTLIITYRWDRLLSGPGSPQLWCALAREWFAHEILSWPYLISNKAPDGKMLDPPATSLLDRVAGVFRGVGRREARLGQAVNVVVVSTGRGFKCEAVAESPSRGRPGMVRRGTDSRGHRP